MHHAGGPARRRPAVPFLVVAVIALVGFVRIALYHWREGAALLALALLVAALLRAVLGDRRCGLLTLRSRVVDVLLYGGFGVAMLVVDLTIVGGPFD